MQKVQELSFAFFYFGIFFHFFPCGTFSIASNRISITYTFIFMNVLF